MSRGIGVISGSSTVLFQGTDDAAFIVGRDAPMIVQISGSLNLRVNGALAGSNRWLRLADQGGSAFWSNMSASVVANTPLGLVTSSDVQSAINELQNHINQITGSGNGSLTFSDGVNSSVISTNGATVTITGSTSIVTTQYAAGKYTLNLAQFLQLTGNTVVVGPFTASNGIVVSTGGLNVQLGSTTLQATTVGPFTASNGISVTGLSSLQTVTLSTLTSSANVYAQQMTVTGSTTLGTSGSQVNTTIINGLFQVPIYTQGNVPPQFVNDPFKYVGYMFYLQGAGSGTFSQGNKWYHNENGTWFPSMFFSGS